MPLRANALGLDLLDRSAARKKALADPEVRQRTSAAIKKAWADQQKHLVGLTEQQIADYRLFRRKGFTKAETMELLKPPKTRPKVRAV